MKIIEIINVIEQIAPLDSQTNWDNSGLQIGNANAQCNSVFITLDVTMGAVAAAKKCGANLIVSHHPLIFDPIKNICADDQIGKIIIEAIKNDITIYASHTPFDIAKGGINDYLVEKLGLINVEPLSDEGIGRVGQLEQSVSIDHFVEMLKINLNLTSIRMSSQFPQFVNKIAVCGGAGGALIDDAIRVNADIFVTGDVKYNNFVKFQNTITVADVGHFETEKQFIELIDALISKKIPTFASHIQMSNPTVIL